MTRQKCVCYPRPPIRYIRYVWDDKHARSCVFSLVESTGRYPFRPGAMWGISASATICENLPRGPTIGPHLGLADRLERWWFVPLFPQW